MHPCKVCKSMVFSLCPELCCHPKQVVFNRFKSLCVFRKMLTQLLVPSLTHVFQANDFTQHLIDELLISEDRDYLGYHSVKEWFWIYTSLFGILKSVHLKAYLVWWELPLQPDACKAEDWWRKGRGASDQLAARAESSDLSEDHVGG